MPNVLHATIVGLASLALLSWSDTVSAEERVIPSFTPAADASDPTPTTIRPALLFGAQPLDQAELESDRGGTQVVNDMTLKGVVADNQATNLTTGANTITEGALSGSSGMPMVVQNSGNNVLIQNATIVNVQVK